MADFSMEDKYSVIIGMDKLTTKEMQHQYNCSKKDFKSLQINWKKVKDSSNSLKKLKKKLSSKIKK